ncbi:hypothetical protein ATCC90586_010155 [Pythium insidiosum]|nr:hypothetical protein ATCC90586_010155 [Pythium insidiosum]
MKLLSRALAAPQQALRRRIAGAAARSFSVASGPTLGVQAAVDDDAPVDPKLILRPEGVDKAKPQFSLDKELPGLPQLRPASQLQAPETEITTLPSGLRVISHETYGQAATLGIFVDAGSRYEDASEVGVTHLLEHLGFKSTTTRSHAELVREIEDIGALTTASCGREQIIYTIDVLRDNAERALELLADSVLHAAFVPEEIDAIKTIMMYQTEDLLENPQALLQEYIHLAAYGQAQALGRPLQCPVDQIERITIDTVQQFRRKHFVADKMVLAGSGIDHQTLVRLAEKLFAHMVLAGSGIDHQTLVRLAEKLFAHVPRASAASDSSASDSTALPAVTYHGGLHAIENRDAPFSYVALAFPTGGWHDDDLLLRILTT